MVRVEPEAEPRTAEPWRGDGPTGEDAGSAGLEGSAREESAKGPRARGSGGSGGGGLFRWRERLHRPGEERNRIDLRNTWQVVAGSILVPLGVVFILIAWYGAAHTPYVQQQIPYLVSGSFAGVACMVLGGLLYWAHWLYRIYDQADHHHEEQLQVMQQTLRVMAEQMSRGTRDGWSDAGSPTAGRAVAAGAALDTSMGRTFVATQGGSVYHDPSCPVVAHHAEGLRVLGEGAPEGIEPCRICLPSEGKGPR
ncbi:MAG: hypothetical protein ACRDV4_09090 [Acidimicrobiales bacterium]